MKFIIPGGGPSLPLSAASGGTGTAANVAATLTRVGNYDLTLTLLAAANVTVPSGASVMAVTNAGQTFTGNQIFTGFVSSVSYNVLGVTGTSLPQLQFKFDGTNWGILDVEANGLFGFQASGQTSTITIQAGAAASINSVVGGWTMHIGTTGGADPVNIKTNGTDRWSFGGTGHLTAVADNTYDIGANGATRPRSIYVGTGITIGAGSPINSSGAGGALGTGAFAAAFNPAVPGNIGGTTPGVGTFSASGGYAFATAGLRVWGSFGGGLWLADDAAGTNPFGFYSNSTTLIFVAGVNRQCQMSPAGFAVFGPSGVGAAANVGGKIFESFADVSTTHTDGTEDDLYSYTTVANQLATNGHTIEQIEHVSFVSSVTAARRTKKYFGGTLIFDSGSLTLSLGGEFDIYTVIVRESSTVVRCTVMVTSTSASTVPYSTYTRITGLTLSSTNVLKTTGIASGTGAASADIADKVSAVFWYPNA